MLGDHRIKKRKRSSCHARLGIFLLRGFRKQVRVFLAAAALLLLTGCWDGEEVNELALVSSMGIDRMENGDIEITVEIVIPQQQGTGGAQSGSSQKGSRQTLIRSATGETVGDAITKLQMILPRTVYWGQMEVLIVGEALARNGFREQLDFLVRDNEVRLRVMPFVIRGNVHKFYSSTYLLEQTKAEVLSGESDRIFYKPVTINPVIQSLGSKSKSPVLPFVDIPRDRKQKSPHIQGVAIFTGNHMSGVMEGDLFSGMKWLLNQINHDIETAKLQDPSHSLVSLEVLSSNTRFFPRLVGRTWQMRVSIQTEQSMIQNTSHLAMSNPKYLKEVEKAMANHIRQKAERSIRKAQSMGADVFGFGEAIHRSNPREWSKLENHWDQIYPSLEVKVEVDVIVRRIGMNAQPVGLTKEEIEK